MVSIVLPTYNEARSIREVLCRASEALRKAEEDHELIVVDDSSPDGTADLAEPWQVRFPCEFCGGRDDRASRLPLWTVGASPGETCWG